MSLLDRYIARGILQATAVVALVIAALSLVVSFIGEADNLGEGDYGLWQILQYILLRLPDDLHVVFPVIAFLGALAALGVLAAGRELMVLQAAGVSVLRLGLSVTWAGVLLAVAALLLGEFFGPRGVEIGDGLRDIARHGYQRYRVDEGIWLRDDGDYVRIGGALAEDRLVDVTLYRRDDRGRLSEIIRAERAERLQSVWRLRETVATRFGDSGVAVQRAAQRDLALGLPPEMLQFSVTKPDELATLGLYRYVRYLERNGVAADQYRLAMWRNIVSPVTVMALALFALPFAFGSLRTGRGGQRLLLGGLAGLVFFMLNEIGVAGGQVAGLPPWLNASLPTLALLLVTLAWLRRMN